MIIFHHLRDSGPSGASTGTCWQAHSLSLFAHPSYLPLLITSFNCVLGTLSIYHGFSDSDCSFLLAFFLAFTSRLRSLVEILLNLKSGDYISCLSNWACKTSSASVLRYFCRLSRLLWPETFITFSSFQPSFLS